MDIIRKASVLDEEDLLLLENHSLDNIYTFTVFSQHIGVNRLMLLVNLLKKYPANKINDIIKEYVEELPNEVNEIDNYGFSPLIMCINHKYLETMKILLNNSKACQDINKKRKGTSRPARYARICNKLDSFKLLIEYDASILKKEDLQFPALRKHINGNSIYKNRVAEIIDNNMLLNIKN